jgi:Xaa-Pro dipeptidase
MENEYQERTNALCQVLSEASIEAAVLTDPDSISYFGGYWNYLGVDFGRPTIMAVSVGAEPVLITPLMESEMCSRMTWVKDVRPWSDGVGGEWRDVLRTCLPHGTHAQVGIERTSIPSLIATSLFPMLSGIPTADVGSLISRLRMIKSPSEIAIMRQAGEVAVAMVEAAKATMGVGVSEYEVSLAAITAGTRKAATFLDAEQDRFVSPLIHNLPILQSGEDTCMVHRRPCVKSLNAGDPVYLCFCTTASFRNYKLGFDREFFIAAVDDEQAHVYEVAVAAQQAAIAAIRPGVTCESVNAVAEEVYKDAGFAAGYRTGRSIGCSYLESPELKRGEGILLEPGMTFAVDGGVTIEGRFGGRIGDSVLVTEDGHEYLTPYPRNLTVL